MNINNKPFRYIEILVHIMVWTLLFCSPFLFMPSEREYDWFRFYQRFCISQIIVITIFYSNYSILINKYLFTKKFGRFFTINVFAIIIGSIIMFVVDDHFIPFDHIKPPRDIPREPPIKFGWVMKILRDSIFYIMTAGLSVAIKMTSQWYNEESQRKELEKNHYQAELKNLKSQLNPHFLFNTLNNIYSLASISSERTQNAIHKLSKLLRYVLYDNNQTEVPLENEIDFINNYLELVKLRLSSKVNVTFNIKGDITNWQIAPMLFISLIENAFKHGVNGSENSFVDITLDVTNEKLRFLVKNSLFPKPNYDKSGSGIGLDNLIKRISIIYGKNGSFKYFSENNEFIALIIIKR